MEERDFVGYGPNPPVIQWPNDAKIAVSVVVNYEEGSEYSLLDGDAHGESMGEVPSPVPVGERDLGQRVLLRIRQPRRRVADYEHT